MPVVTIRGQLGSGAMEIGREVADRLHAEYVDREIISQIATMLDRHKQDVTAKEMPPGSLAGRIAQALGRGYLFNVDYRGIYLPTWEMPLEDTRYLEALESVIKELAGSQLIVIAGRGSQFILKNHPGAFHVLVVAPLGQRVKEVMESRGLNEEAARKEIERYDGSRRQFIRRYFQSDLENPEHYDLVVNTENLSYEAAAAIIIAAMPFKKKTAGEAGSQQSG